MIRISYFDIFQFCDKKNAIALMYGDIDYEERFRNFLVNEAQIGIELLQGNLLHSQRLFATFRWQVIKANLSFERHLEPTFKKYSSTYNSWKKDDKLQFFIALREWPIPLQVDWAHMMVNLILAGDWNQEIIKPNYKTPGEPFSIPQINKILSDSGMEFQIPLEWKMDFFEEN